MYKKILAIILFALMALTVCSCEKSHKKLNEIEIKLVKHLQERKERNKEQQESDELYESQREKVRAAIALIDPSDELIPESTQESTQESQGKEKIIYENHNIKVTYLGIEKGKTLTNIKILVENTSDVAIVIQTRECMVNKLVPGGTLSAVVQPNTKINTEIIVWNFHLNDNNIKNIKSIKNLEFKFLVCNEEITELIFETGTLKLEF